MKSLCSPTHKLGKVEMRRRFDGKWNHWQWRFLFPDDTLPRWVLVNVK